MTKKKKSFKISDFRIVFVFIVIFALFLFLVSYLDSDKFYCSKNPDKCVCEKSKIAVGTYQKQMAIDKGFTNCIDEDNGQWMCKKCYQSRKKTQAELDIDDCNNNPRDDEKCKCVLKTGCEHWLQLLNYDCSHWNTFNCSYWKEDITFGYNYCINYISECIKSRPKTEWEKHPEDYVAEIKSEHICNINIPDDVYKVEFSDTYCSVKLYNTSIIKGYYEIKNQTTYRLKNECEKKNYYKKYESGEYYSYFCKGIENPIHSLRSHLFTPEELKYKFDCDVEYRIINPDWVEETITLIEGCNEFGCVTVTQDWDIETVTIQGNPITFIEVIKNETICREKIK